jgi:hypothetical protein
MLLWKELYREIFVVTKVMLQVAVWLLDLENILLLQKSQISSLKRG